MSNLPECRRHQRRPAMGLRPRTPATCGLAAARGPGPMTEHRTGWIRDPADPATQLDFYLGAHQPRWLEHARSR